ncbi:hypothetical protein RLOC_00002908 [Lonchura striata]|uniref:Uncharacterized protein n=2 Tax=Lonchura striata TaxID=40157 RepID=A0A218UEC6_9PASE|nr:hypothetical protein RLOC_00002908 [Lonchura striata domestica]
MRRATGCPLSQICIPPPAVLVRSFPVRSSPEPRGAAGSFPCLPCPGSGCCYPGTTTYVDLGGLAVAQAAGRANRGLVAAVRAPACCQGLAGCTTTCRNPCCCCRVTESSTRSQECCQEVTKCANTCQDPCCQEVTKCATTCVDPCCKEVTKCVTTCQDPCCKEVTKCATTCVDPCCQEVTKCVTTCVDPC